MKFELGLKSDTIEKIYHFYIEASMLQITEIQEIEILSTPKKKFAEPIMEKVDITLTESHITTIGAPHDLGAYTS